MSENRLPKYIIDKSIKSGNEYGWKQTDFLDVVEAARQIPMAVIGGQIQYVFPDGICELYWLNYDSKERQPNEDWLNFCSRTAKECTDKFNILVSTTDIEKEALRNFDFLQNKKNIGFNIEEYIVFILYFDDNN